MASAPPEASTVSSSSLTLFREESLNEDDPPALAEVPLSRDVESVRREGDVDVSDRLKSDVPFGYIGGAGALIDLEAGAGGGALSCFNMREL